MGDAPTARARVVGNRKVQQEQRGREIYGTTITNGLSNGRLLWECGSKLLRMDHASEQPAGHRKHMETSKDMA